MKLHRSTEFGNRSIYRRWCWTWMLLLTLFCYSNFRWTNCSWENFMTRENEQWWHLWMRVCSYLCRAFREINISEHSVKWSSLNKSTWHNNTSGTWALLLPSNTYPSVFLCYQMVSPHRPLNQIIAYKYSENLLGIGFVRQKHSLLGELKW